jgi:hypothetical protein
MRSHGPRAEQVHGHGRDGRREVQHRALRRCGLPRFEQRDDLVQRGSDHAAGSRSVQNSAYADSSKGGKERTMLQVAFCPGGGIRDDL